MLRRCLVEMELVTRMILLLMQGQLRKFVIG